MNANETDTESTRLELQGSTVVGTEGPELSNVSEDRGPRSSTRGPLHLSRPTWITRFAKQRSTHTFRQRDQFQTRHTNVACAAQAPHRKTTNQKGLSRGTSHDHLCPDPSTTSCSPLFHDCKCRRVKWTECAQKGMCATVNVDCLHKTAVSSLDQTASVTSRAAFRLQRRRRRPTAKAYRASDFA